MARVEINLVAAVEQSGGIGKDGGLPWHLPSDWNHFLRLATREGAGRGVCWIMGVKSYLEHNQVGGLFSQLEGEGKMVYKIVLSTRSRQQLGLDQKIRLANNWEQVLEQVRELASESGVETFWNLGGGGVYAAQLTHTNTLQGSRLFLTKVHADFDCNVHFPDLAPFGLRLNSADTSLKGLKTDLRLVEVEDTDVQVDQVFSENGTKFTFHVFQFEETKQ